MGNEGKDGQKGISVKKWQIAGVAAAAVVFVVLAVAFAPVQGGAGLLGTAFNPLGAGSAEEGGQGGEYDPANPGDPENSDDPGSPDDPIPGPDNPTDPDNPDDPIIDPDGPIIDPDDPNIDPDEPIIDPDDPEDPDDPGIKPFADGPITLDLDNIDETDERIVVSEGLVTVHGEGPVTIKGNSGGRAVEMRDALAVFIEGGTALVGSDAPGVKGALIVPGGSVVTGMGGGISIRGGEGMTGICGMGSIELAGEFGDIVGGDGTGNGGTGIYVDGTLEITGTVGDVSGGDGQDGGSGICADMVLISGSVGNISGGDALGGLTFLGPGGNGGDGVTGIYVDISGNVGDITGGKGGEARGRWAGSGIRANYINIGEGANLGDLSGGSGRQSGRGVWAYDIYADEVAAAGSGVGIPAVDGEAEDVVHGIGGLPGVLGSDAPGRLGDGDTPELLGDDDVPGVLGIYGKVGDIRSGEGTQYTSSAIYANVVEIGGVAGDISGGRGDSNGGHGLLLGESLEISGTVGNIVGGYGKVVGGNGVQSYNTITVSATGVIGGIEGGSTELLGGFGVFSGSGLVAFGDIAIFGRTGRIIGGGGFLGGSGMASSIGIVSIEASGETGDIIGGSVSDDIEPDSGGGGDGISGGGGIRILGRTGAITGGTGGTGEGLASDGDIEIIGVVDGGISGGDGRYSGEAISASYGGSLSISGVVNGDIIGGSVPVDSEGESYAGYGIRVSSYKEAVNISGTVNGSIIGGSGGDFAGGGIYATEYDWPDPEQGPLELPGKVVIGGKVAGEIRGGSGLDIDTLGGSYAILDRTDGQLIRVQNSDPAGGNTVVFDYSGTAPTERVRGAYVTDGGRIPAFAVANTGGKTFEGWYTAASGGRLWDFGADSVSSDMTLYARWSKQTTVTSVEVNPSSVTVKHGTTFKFSATVKGEGSPSQSVKWTVTGGGAGTSISTSGVLTVAAGETVGAHLTVRAVSTLDASKSGTSTVTVSDADQPAATVASVDIIPRTVILNKGATYTFSDVVKGTNSPSQEVVWTVTGGGAGTSISESGRLTIGEDETATRLEIKGVSKLDNSKSDTAIVTVVQAIGDPVDPFHVDVDIASLADIEILPAGGGDVEPQGGSAGLMWLWIVLAIAAAGAAFVMYRRYKGEVAA
ncbi:MAG: InlB B-repeat-containing protein [Clostridiales bacterium]|nr:InlB B-repeat-containing protein [Clostridiales bacterium]